MRNAAGDLTGSSSLPYALRNWVVNGVISLLYLPGAAVGAWILVLVALDGLGLINEVGEPSEVEDGTFDLADLVFALAYTSFWTVLFVRSWTRGVVATPAGLQVRKVFKTRVIKWCDIDRIRIRVDDAEDQMTWYSPVVKGPFSTHELGLPIATGSDRRAWRHVDRLNTTLAQQRASGGTCP